jgi:hypothetical protein
MRTNVNIDDDAREFAEYFAHANGITLGEAITSLIRKSMDAQTVASKVEFERSPAGFPMFPSRGRVITSEMVRAELEDLL